jgi:hypothetical protein
MRCTYEWQLIEEEKRGFRVTLPLSRGAIGTADLRKRYVRKTHRNQA